jgi:hypothetical protein
LRAGVVWPNTLAEMPSTPSRQPTIFLGCGFAAKYRLGGGNFSVPLQWALGLKRLNRDFVWLEVMPASQNPEYDRMCIRSFRDRLAQHGLENHYCLILQKPAADAHDLDSMRFHGLSKRQIEDRLAGPNVLLNLSYSIHPPYLHRFEKRIFCDLDPSEISFWMTRVEMGQSHHHEFWSIGLNRGAADCRTPDNGLPWKTFFPLVDTTLFQPAPRPRRARFTTIGQWYWANNIEVDGGFPDLSKGAKFQPFLTLPSRVPPGVEMELAMNLEAGSPERTRLEANGWRMVEPHEVASSPFAYRRYVRGATGEFTTIKGVDCLWQTGWVSDRAAAFLASGRPVITEDAGVSRYLPAQSGFMEIHTLDEASEAIGRSVRDWPAISKQARACAEECFEATKTLRRILGD